MDAKWGTSRLSVKMQRLSNSRHFAQRAGLASGRMIPDEAQFYTRLNCCKWGACRFPTETVYGLGAMQPIPPQSKQIFAAKGRPADHPLIVHLAGHDVVDHWAEQVPECAWELMETFWPGPFDPDPQNKPGCLMRSPADRIRLVCVCLAIRSHWNWHGAFARVNQHGGIAAPSANRFGRISRQSRNMSAKNWVIGCR